MKTATEPAAPLRMHNPPHPGEVLHDLFLYPEHICIAHAARALGVSRKHLSAIVNGRSSVTPDMALRLEIALGMSAETWLGHQMAYDLWKAEQRREELGVCSLRAA